MNDHSLIARIDRHGPALVAIVLALVSLAYLADAAAASTRLHNLLLLVPLVGFIVIMAAVVTIGHYRGGPIDEVIHEDEEGELQKSAVSNGGIALMMAALVLYACLAPYIGFDVASALFIALCLWIQGERRPVFVVVYSVLFAAAITWSLAHVAGAAVPTLII